MSPKNQVLPRVTEATAQMVFELVCGSEDTFDATPWLEKIEKENPKITELIKQYMRTFPQDTSYEAIEHALTGFAFMYVLLDAQATADSIKI